MKKILMVGLGVFSAWMMSTGETSLPAWYFWARSVLFGLVFGICAWMWHYSIRPILTIAGGSVLVLALGHVMGGIDGESLLKLPQYSEMGRALFIAVVAFLTNWLMAGYYERRFRRWRPR